MGLSYIMSLPPLHSGMQLQLHPDTHILEQVIANTFSHRPLALDDGDASIFSTNGQAIPKRTITLLFAAPLTHLDHFEHTMDDVERAFGSYRFFSANGMCHLRVDGTRFS